MFYLDGVDPLRTLLGRHAPPFASNRRIGAALLCDYRRSGQSGGGEDEFRELRDEHSWR